MIIDNRAGASGTVGTGYAAKAAPDGYAGRGDHHDHRLGPGRLPQLPYDPLADLVPVRTIGTTPFVLVVSPELPAQNLPDFIRHAKAQAGKLNYGSIGNGTARATSRRSCSSSALASR